MQAKTSQQTKECGATSLIEKQIYIVDDDKSVCRALKLLMLTYGFAVDTFLSAEDFFSAVPNNIPGCLILDVNLPGLNGWDAQQRLRKTGSNRPVIMISADKNEGLAEKALKVGVVGFLQKPFNDQELVELINQKCFNYKENEVKKYFLLILAGLFLTTSIMGCNMMRGAGKDVENAGGSIQRTVDHND